MSNNLRDIISIVALILSSLQTVIAFYSLMETYRKDTPFKSEKNGDISTYQLIYKYFIFDNRALLISSVATIFLEFLFAFILVHFNGWINEFIFMIPTITSMLRTTIIYVLFLSALNDMEDDGVQALQVKLVVFIFRIIVVVVCAMLLFCLFLTSDFSWFNNFACIELIAFIPLLCGKLFSRDEKSA